MKIGQYEISSIETGDFKLDGGAMFGVVPKTLWNKLCPSDEFNRIKMTARCLLIEGNGKKILVDAGVGDKDDEKFKKIFEIDFTRNTLEKSLGDRGIKPEQITDFIYTHLHFDHAGGSTKIENDEVIPVFPKAKHYVQRKQYEHAFTRNERDRASYIDRNYEPVKSAGLLELIEGDIELFPGLHIINSFGHTPFLQTIKITDGKTTLWYPTDLIPLAAHVPLPYIMGYDLFPMATLADKKRILPQAVEENWIVCYEHDPFNVAHRLKRDEKSNIIVGEAVAF